MVAFPGDITHPFQHGPFSGALSSSHAAHHGHAGHAVLLILSDHHSALEPNPRALARVPCTGKAAPARPFRLHAWILPLLQPALRFRDQSANPLAWSC